MPLDRKNFNTGEVFIRRRRNRQQFWYVRGVGGNAAGRGAGWLGNSISKPNIFVGDDVADWCICPGYA